MKAFAYGMACLAAAALLAAGCAGTRPSKRAAPQAIQGPIRVCVVTGGHDFDIQPFFDMWKSFPGIAHTHDVQPLAVQRLGPSLRNTFDAVVFYDMTPEIAEPHRQAFLDLLNQGIGVVFLHHSIGSYQDWDVFHDIVGGRYRMNPGTRGGKPMAASSYVHDVDVPVRIADTNHPVTAGLRDFTLRDEVYGDVDVLPDVHPLLFTTHPKSSPCIGWWRIVGKSRVVTLQPGHDRNAFEDPNYRTLVRQAVGWVARRALELVPAEALTDWSGAGLLPGTPRKAEAVFDVTKEPDGTWDDRVGSAVRKAGGSAGLSVVYFPPGTYRLTRGIVLSGTGSSGIVFQGAGEDSTVLEFQIGRDGICFDVNGTPVGNELRLSGDMPKRSKRIRAAGLSAQFAEGDWVRLCEASFPDADPNNVGQTTRVAEAWGDSGILEDEATKTYLAANNLWIQKVEPVQNVGFEGFTLRRLDNQPSTQNAYGLGDNFKFDNAVNCWIRGVSSVNTSRHHVVINRSAHIEVSGSTFAEAVSRDENSYGYGVLIEVCSNNCLFQNNAFRRLRHSMTICEGVNGNVFAFNFSRDQGWTFHGFPNIFQGADLCLHGRYPYANLFEQNVVEFAYADNSHGANGPFNVFLRNWVYHGFEGRGLIRLFRAPESVVLGNISTPMLGARVKYEKCKPFADALGLEPAGRKFLTHDEFRSASGSPADANLDVVSYFYRERPRFLTPSDTWPSIGPAAGGLTPKQAIPAMDRFKSGRAAVAAERTERGK